MLLRSVPKYSFIVLGFLLLTSLSFGGVEEELFLLYSKSKSFAHGYVSTASGVSFPYISLYGKKPDIDHPVHTEDLIFTPTGIYVNNLDRISDAPPRVFTLLIADNKAMFSITKPISDADPAYVTASYKQFLKSKEQPNGYFLLEKELENLPASGTISANRIDNSGAWADYGTQVYDIFNKKVNSLASNIWERAGDAVVDEISKKTVDRLLGSGVLQEIVGKTTKNPVDNKQKPQEQVKLDEQSQKAFIEEIGSAISKSLKAEIKAEDLSFMVDEKLTKMYDHEFGADFLKRSGRWLSESNQLTIHSILGSLPEEEQKLRE
jgi:hypothetical protein